MKTVSCVLLALGVVLLAGATTGRAQGDPAVTFTGGTQGANGTDFTIGYEFTLSTASLVTELGYYDDGGDGFADSHAVGIWNSGGQLLGSLTVTTSDTLTDGFRYAALSVPLMLQPGQTYTVGGVSGVTDQFVYQTTGTVFDPAVTFISNAYVVAGTLTDPTSTSPGQGYSYFGGSFELEPVPEPSTWACAAVGGLGVLLVRRARDRRAGV